MAAAQESRPAPSGLSDWLMELTIGVAVLVLGSAVWLYTHFSQSPEQAPKPRPVWLGMPKLVVQMADGRMLNMKLNLQLDHEKSASELQSHLPAFQTLVQVLCMQTPREDIQGRAGMKRFGTHISGTLNKYLQEREAQGRVKEVAFEELTLVP